MKTLTAYVRYVDRRCATSNITPKREGQANIKINRTGNGGYVLIINTFLNKTRLVYSLNRENLLRIRDNYVKEGKATLIFQNPPHDIFIRCYPGPAALIQFVNRLKSLRNGQCNDKMKNNIPLVTQDMNQKLIPQVKDFLVIKNKDDYKKFPIHRYLKSLQISLGDLTTFYSSVFRLQNLSILNLSENSFSTIPKQIELLPNLSELNLENNNLGLCKNWNWLTSANLRENLKILNLNRNKISKFLPDEIKSLKALSTLDIAYNQIRYLPNWIGRLKALRNLNVMKNEIEYLPGSIRKLRLNNLDLSHNSFCLMEGDFSLDSCETKVYSLLDLSLCSVLQNSLPYDDLPATLINYIENCNLCKCLKYSIDREGYFDRFSIKNHIPNTTLDEAHYNRGVMIFYAKCVPKLCCNLR